MPFPNQQPLEQPQQDAAVQLTVKQLTSTFGDSGTERYGGYVQEEYNPDWRDEQRIENVEEMRRGDAACRAALRAIKAPILATEWNVVTDGDDPKDEDIRKFVESCLFGMKRTWKEFLREALAYLDFGFYPFELIWEKRGGKIVLADLAPRIPHSVLKWQLKDGTPGIVQLLKTDHVKTSEAEIPMEKLLVFTNDKEGDDITGQSILRTAWKHYQIKSLLEKLQAISAERYGVGIPVVTPGEAAGEADKAEGEDMAANIRSNEKGFIVLPRTGWKVEILTPGANGTSQQIEQGIQHHSKQILISVLANFLALGTDGTGSYALSQDQSSFFLKVGEDIVTYIREQLDKQVIKRMVDLNFGEQENYPYIKSSALGDIDYGKMSDVLATLAGAGLIKIDWKLKQHIHNEFRLPTLSDEELEMMKEQDIEQELAGLESEGDGMDLPEDEEMDMPDDQDTAPEDDAAAAQTE